MSISIEEFFAKHRPEEIIGDWNTPEARAALILKNRLTDYQRKVFEGLDWFCYGPRASGRTSLAVSVAICHCLENPHKEAVIIDHYDMHHHDYLRDEVMHQLDLLPAKIANKFDFRIRRGKSLHLIYQPRPG